MWDIGENGRRSGLALTDEQVGKTGRGGLLFYDIEVLTISDMNESVGDGFAEGSAPLTSSSKTGS